MADPLIIFRLDATSKIGSGHAMRCRAIARALNVAGARTVFAVASQESADFLAAIGCDARVLGGDPLRLTEADGLALTQLAHTEGAGVVFIDTYGVTKPFFSALQDQRFRVAYLDDLYTFELGKMEAPIRRPVDLVLNYSFYANERTYSDVYGQRQRKLLGPRYAPLGEGFVGRRARSADVVRDLLVTTGSTNPDHMLERMAKGCLDGCDANVNVVIGPKASFDVAQLGVCDAELRRLCLRHDVRDMAALMERCDMAVTAGGTTLYELCAMSIPTITIPIVDNQLQNVQSFAALGLGVALSRCDIDEKLTGLADEMAGSLTNRRRYISRMGEVVDGRGSQLVAGEIVSLAGR